MALADTAGALSGVASCPEGSPPPLPHPNSNSGEQANTANFTQRAIGLPTLNIILLPCLLFITKLMSKVEAHFLAQDIE
jgi:hypothetical protein